MAAANSDGVGSRIDRILKIVQGPSSKPAAESAQKRGRNRGRRRSPRRGGGDAGSKQDAAGDGECALEEGDSCGVHQEHLVGDPQANCEGNMYGNRRNRKGGGFDARKPGEMDQRAAEGARRGGGNFDSSRAGANDVAGRSQNGAAQQTTSLNPNAPIFIPAEVAAGVLDAGMFVSMPPACADYTSFFSAGGHDGWCYGDVAWPPVTDGIFSGPNQEGSMNSIARGFGTLPEVVCGTREKEFIGLQCIGEMGNWVVLRENKDECEPFFWHRVTGVRTWDVPQNIRAAGIAHKLVAWSKKLPATGIEPGPEAWPEPLRRNRRGTGWNGHDTAPLYASPKVEVQLGADDKGRTKRAARRSSWRPQYRGGAGGGGTGENGHGKDFGSAARRARSAHASTHTTWQPKVTRQPAPEVTGQGAPADKADNVGTEHSGS